MPPTLRRLCGSKTPKTPGLWEPRNPSSPSVNLGGSGSQYPKVKGCPAWYIHHLAKQCSFHIFNRDVHLNEPSGSARPSVRPSTGARVSLGQLEPQDPSPAPVRPSTGTYVSLGHAPKTPSSLWLKNTQKLRGPESPRNPPPTHLLTPRGERRVSVARNIP